MEVLRFPSFAFVQDFEQEGTLIRLEVCGSQMLATIQDFDIGNEYSFSVGCDLAQELAAYLLGEPIRLVGSGCFYRETDGKWNHKSLQAERFVPLKTNTLENVIKQIRDIPNLWRTDIDLMNFVLAMRVADAFREVGVAMSQAAAQTMGQQPVK